MPRPSLAQACLGSFTVVATTVALLAVAGASGVLAVSVLVGFALALGTVVTVLSMSAAAARAATEAPDPAAPATDPAEAATAAAGHAYARQR
ncbi:hypothetical protein ABZW03_31975 [Kitasatospora sp. NPDC004799]|uniref:hypothetical protein n=1 Tax=Kitasatospora sp. NPDC004799 TaxID=3154460 RepID=UPI0033A30FA8